MFQNWVTKGREREIEAFNYLICLPEHAQGGSVSMCMCVCVYVCVSMCVCVREGRGIISSGVLPSSRNCSG